MIILIGGKQYAVGLNWFSISSTDEIEQFKHEMEMTCGIIKLATAEGMPSAVALASNEYLNQTSLAAALSYAHENLLYVYKTEYKDEAGRLLYYFCCVKRGVVTVDGDTVGDIDTIQSLYAQSLLDLRNDLAEDKIECLGVGADDNRFEALHSVDETQILTSIQRFESQCVVKELHKKGPAKWMLGLVAAGIVAMMYLGYQWFLKPPPPPPPSPVAERAPPPPPDPFTQFLNSVSFSSTATPAALPLITDAISNIPMQIKGWTVTGISINLGATTTFSVSFSRTPYATVLDLKAQGDAGVLKNLNIDGSGDSASADWPAEVDNVPLLTEQALTPIKTEEGPVYQLQFQTQLQYQKLDIKLNSPSPVQGFAVQTFSYQGNGLWGLRGFYNVFQTMSTLGITSITITPDSGDFAWTIQGVIYG